MSFLWNDIKAWAAVFINEGKKEAPVTQERAQSAEFMLGFLKTFGDEEHKKAIRDFKVPMGKNENVLFGTEHDNDQNRRIDFACLRGILIERKKTSEDLEKVYTQARFYANTLSVKEFPQGILISDFFSFHYYDFTIDFDLDPDGYIFILLKLTDYIILFVSLNEYNGVRYKRIDSINIVVAKIRERHYGYLKEIDYTCYTLELYLIRFLFYLLPMIWGFSTRPILFISYIMNCTRKSSVNYLLKQKRTRGERCDGLSLLWKTFRFPHGIILRLLRPTIR
jgi:hypothetical protein